MEENKEDLKAFIRARYGENRRISGDYNRELAVKCINGTFVGVKKGNIISYKGIPFVGEQPVGKNRFKKPVPFGTDEGVYEAYHFGKGSLQPETQDDAGALAVLGEDCLYLNIWKNTAEPADKKPVMVWIHGGGFTQGSTINPLYDGFNFVRDNPVGKAIQWDLYNTDTKPVMVFDEFNIHQSTEGDYGLVDWERTYPLTKYFIF